MTCARKPRVWTTARTGKCDRDGYCTGERSVGVEKGVRGVLGVMEDPDTEGIMEELGQNLGSELQFTDKEREGVVIGRKEVEEALIGFHSILLAEVLTERVVNAEAFIDRFTSLDLRGGNAV